MKTPLIALALFALPMLGGQALASEDCAVPEGAAQSKEALQQKLEAEGWQVRQIKLENGCYEVYAVKADGSRIESEFNMATLQSVDDEDENRGGDSDSDNGRDSNGDDDGGSDDSDDDDGED